MAMAAVCSQRGVIRIRDRVTSFGYRIDLQVLTLKGKRSYECKSLNPFSSGCTGSMDGLSYEFENDISRCIKKHNNVVNGKQKGKDGYDPSDWFQQQLKYIVVTPYGGVNSEVKKFIDAIIPKPEDDIDFYKSWRMNPLSKNTWLSFLQIKQYEFRFLATVGIVKSIAPVLLLRATALADTFNKTQKDEGSGNVDAENASSQSEPFGRFTPSHILLGDTRVTSFRPSFGCN